MFDWNEQGLGDIIWGEAGDVDDHIVPYPEGNEEKLLGTYDDHKKKQCIQESRSVKLGDKKVSGANSLFSSFKDESSSQCNTNGASGAEMDSWPDSPLTNAACDGEYMGKNAQSSMNLEVSDHNTDMPKYDSTRAQFDDRHGFFGNQCEDHKHGGFLEYSWENIGTFDDLDNMFRNDDPLFGRAGLGNEELWSSTAELFSSPAKSFPTCSPNSGINSLSTSEQEMKLESVLPEDPHNPGFGRVDHLGSYAMKDVDMRKDKAVGKEFCQFVDPGVDCVGGKNKISPEKTHVKMTKTNEAWNTHSTSKIQVSGKRKSLNYPSKEESQDRSFQDLHGSWPVVSNGSQSLGNHATTSTEQTIPSSVGSQKQPSVPKPFLYWQTSHPYLSTEDGNLQQQYPVMTLPNVNSERDKHQTLPSDPGHFPGLKVFPAPSRPPVMTPQEKLEKLKRRQQMQAILAIQEQQQQFGHKVPHIDLYNAEKCTRENQCQETEGSIIEIQESLKIPPSMELNSPIEHDDSNTVSMVADECPLEERVLDQLQDVIGKLDIKVRLCIRDSLFRLAQSAMQRHNTMETSSINNNMQSDGSAGKDESYGCNRLPRIPDVETETNPIDRTIAHLLFHQPVESSTRPVNGGEIHGSSGFSKPVNEPKAGDIKNVSSGCLSDITMDKQSLSQPSCMGSDTKDVGQFQSNTYINTPEKTPNGELEDRGE